MITIIICILLIATIMVAILALIMNSNRPDALIGLLLGVFLLALVGIMKEETDPSIKPIDVYKNKTTLEITYRDSIPVDTTVIWREDIK